MIIKENKLNNFLIKKMNKIIFIYYNHKTYRVMEFQKDFVRPKTYGV